MIPISSWGRLSAPEHELVVLKEPSAVAAQLAGETAGLACGMRRSYGDVCLNPGGRLWQTTALDRLISFDAQRGILRCEAGVLLRDIQQLLAPRGWLLPVTPGTQLITVGGAIACDVHGKAHHAFGSFGEHVFGLRLLRTDGEIIDCAPDLRSDWFAATVGGLGLTGVIVEVSLRLRRIDNPWVLSETRPFDTLDEFFALSAEPGWEQSVSWIDCYSGDGGRGIFMRANPAPAGTHGPLPGSGKRTVPFVPPVSLVNGLSLPLFNKAYYRLQRWQSGQRIAHYEPFSYPLDNLLEWNRMYGPRGFYQYQSVVPPGAGPAAVQAMLSEIAHAGEGSFLAVLKTFGERPAPGMLSFPQPGVTLALDFPNRGERTLALFERLDAIVREAGGRLYAAKDARMPRELFERGYPRLPEFLPFRDPGISSGLSRRLLGS